MMLLSVVIPAFNEESYLTETLSAILLASAACRCGVEVIVADNWSADRTAEIARTLGARVVQEQINNVARARNAGARAAHGDVLVFIDADTLVPCDFLDEVAATMSDPACMGGSADIVHTARSRLLRAYLKAWRWLGLSLAMAQGAAQFCRASTFNTLNGYDEALFMGEDVDFYWRLRKLSSKAGAYLKFRGDLKVRPSPRRFDKTPTWRTLVWTNPVFALLFRKTPWAWNAWYVRPPR